MKKSFKKLLSLTLAAALCVAGVSAPEQAQAKEKASYATRADVITAVNQLTGASLATKKIKNVKDVKRTDAYYRDMSIAMRAGLITPTAAGKLHPKTKATNNYIAVVLARITGMSKQVILDGRGKNGYMTKEQLASFLDGIFPNVVSSSVSEVKKGNVIINKPGVTLKDVTVAGNLIIGDGVGDQEVTLDNVTVEGKTVVRGGGENSVIITGASSLSEIIMKQTYSGVSLKISGDANVKAVFINDGSNDVKIVGSVGNLVVEGADIKVDLKEASIETVTVQEKAEGVQIETGDDTKINSLVLNAKNTSVSGSGKVESVQVNADDVALNMENIDASKVNVKDGVKNTVVNGDANKPADGSSGDQTDTGTDSSAGGSASSGFGPVIMPDVEPTETRFETGYPKAELDKAAGTLSVTYKLKEGVASESNPAEIYNVITWSDPNDDVNSEAILHGHAGIAFPDEDTVLWANLCDYIKVTDAEEHVLTYSVDDYGFGLSLYSVIKSADGTVSPEPVANHWDAETAGSFLDVQGPDVYYAAVNKAGDKLYAYLNEKADRTSLPSEKCFAVTTSDGEIVTTAASITIQDSMDRFYASRDMVVITLDKPLEQTVESGRYNYYLEYEKQPDSNPLQDTNQNESESFRQIIRTADDGCGVISLEDGSYASIRLPLPALDGMSVYPTLMQMTVKINGETVPSEKKSITFYAMNLFEIECSNLGLNTAITSIEVSAPEEMSDLAGDPWHTWSFTEENIQKAPDVELISATYSKSSKQLSIQVKNAFSWGPACALVVQVNGKEYRLRGMLSWSSGELVVSENGLKHLNLTDADLTGGMKIKYQVNYFTYSSSYIQNEAGKPLANTDYIDVTIED